MIKLKRLKINRYRNVEPCELVFSDRFNILLGPNGAGKTTLLNLISKVLGSNLGDTSDPFSIEIELSFPGGTLSGKIQTYDKTRSEQDALPPELRSARATRPGVLQMTHVPEFELRMRRFAPPSTITITRMIDSITARVDTNPETTTWALWFFEPTFLSLLGQVSSMASLSTMRFDSGISVELRNVARFDESLDTFRSITARQDDITVVSAELRPLLEYWRVAPGKVLNGQPNPVITTFGIVPLKLASLVESHPPDGATEIPFNNDNMQFLTKACELLGLSSSTAKLELIGKRFEKDPGAEVFAYGNLKFWFTRKDGSIFQDQHLSYGQKRLLTFLYYLDANPSIVIADELVNGLHHAWIKECMEAIGDRQAFLTSQNPLLLDYLFFDSVEQVKESFILCRTEPVGDSEKMIWRNLTDDEAAMFYSAYKVGIEHVGEILRTRGLW